MIEAMRIHESGRASRAEAIPFVFVVDDDTSERDSLELLIKETGWQALRFGCAAEFLAYPKTPAPSCLVLDVGLPHMNGLNLQERITFERPTTPIIFVAAHADTATTVRAMKAGAMEFLIKPLSGDAVLNAIEVALQASREALAHEAEMKALRNRYASLTRRETEVMTLVVAGRLNKQVGAEVGISEITVKQHRGQMMRKMEARSLPDLVRMASRLGIAM